MASAATHAGFRPGTGETAAPASAQQRARPFIQASKHGIQPALNFTDTPTTTLITHGPTPLPAAGGYLRRIFLEYVATGGGATTPGVGTSDYPWNLIAAVRLLEPNSTPIVDLTGYNLFVADCYGGYVAWNDPRNDPDFSASGSNPVIEPFIPIELDSTAVGSLADLSSSSAFQLFLQTNTLAAAWGTSPSPVPSIAITTFQDYWTLPNPTDAEGQPQATAPPFPGTIQLWSNLLNISIATNQRVQMTRMGNQLRTVAMVFRAAAGTTRTDIAPNNLTLRWDDVILKNTDLQTIRKKMREYCVGLSARDTGVYVLPYSFGVNRYLGGNGVSSYLPTVTATRFEISGPIASGTPVVDFVVNEVSSAPVSGLERTTVGGGVQYYPPAPPPAGPGVM